MQDLKRVQGLELAPASSGSSESPPEPPPTADAVHEPAGRPWELELLISGAVVFALLQLPAWLDQIYGSARPHLEGSVRTVLFSLYFGAKVVVFALVAAFVLHLAARAYWVGLVGLDAVFPHGVRWERTRYGVISRRDAQERLPSVQEMINRADRFCSIIFSSAFLLVFLLFLGSLLAAGLSLPALAISHFLLGGDHFSTLHLGLLAVLMLVTTVPQLLDRRYGRRMMELGWPARVVRASNRLQYRWMVGAAYMPIMNVLSSNLRQRTVNAVLFTTLFLLEGLVLVHLLASDGKLSLGDYAYLEAVPEERGMDFRHYQNRRPADQIYELEPSIQADMIREPFVRLFLPYVPRRHNPLVAERCPEAGAARDGAAADALLRCLAGLQPVTLNGAPRSDLDFRLYREPETGLRGLVAYIPTAELPAGENLLVVAPIPRPRDAGKQRGEPLPPHYIPFWIGR